MVKNLSFVKENIVSIVIVVCLLTPSALFGGVYYYLYNDDFVTASMRGNDPAREMVALQQDFIEENPVTHKEHQVHTIRDVTVWAENAVLETLSISHKNADEHLERASRHFTVGGWDSFSKALVASKIVEMVEAYSQDMIPVLGDVLKTEVIETPVRQDVPSWIVKVPISIIYKSGSTETVAHLLVTVSVVQSTEVQNSQSGLAIKQWIAVMR